ncbi:hypothetical protein JCM16161A_22350 [Vulcanisaeta sp. JCM 16161]|uniref:ATP-binding protein n=1 Tax=Vulcanisaeta sp. JCM 16161 TaxID=1295372 RepID=UPI0006D18220|nr:ATP-binding protein [Vulcanisaeta sp. JCM 16161]
MHFDLHPKEVRDEEVEYVKRQVRAGNWVVISGQRGIGKTSLMRVVINELSREFLRRGLMSWVFDSAPLTPSSTGLMT